MDSDLLCNHLSTLMSGKVQQRDIDSFVERLSNMDKAGHFVSFSKSLSKGLKRLVSREREPFRDLESMTLKWESFSGELGKCYPSNRFQIPNSDYVRSLLHIVDECPALEAYLLSGHMKLHTARATRRNPSRSVVSAVRKTIAKEAPAIEQSYLSLFKDECEKLCQEIIDSDWYDHRRSYMTLLDLPSNPNKNSYSLGSQISKSRDSLELYDLRSIFQNQEIQDLILAYPEESLNTLLSAGQSSISIDINRLPSPTESPIGSISMIPERADKYRVVAVPSLAVLCMNKPLAGVLSQVHPMMRTQGVKSHDDTTRELSHLLDGVTTFHSMDMSNFTDRFPYALQRVLLETMVDYGLILPFDLKVQDMVCTSEYDFHKKPIRYGAGTPQGTFASFPLASICNGLVANMCYNYSHNINTSPFSDNPYRIIGDDTVIYDDSTYDMYKDVMTDLGVEVSLDKTINSKRVVEMCSKLITTGQVDIQKKIKPLDTEGSLIEHYQYYRGELTLPGEYSYLYLLPYPFGVGEPDDTDITTIISRYQSEINSLTSVRNEKDFRILFARDTLPEFLIWESADWEPPIRSFTLTPLEESYLRDAQDILDNIRERSDILDDFQIAKELDEHRTIFEKINVLAQQFGSRIAGTEPGPSVPGTGTLERNNQSSFASKVGKRRFSALDTYYKEVSNDNSEQGEAYEPSL